MAKGIGTPLDDEMTSRPHSGCGELPSDPLIEIIESSRGYLSFPFFVQRDIMARSGPEDYMEMSQVEESESPLPKPEGEPQLRTAGGDWGVFFPGDDRTVEEMEAGKAPPLPPMDFPSMDDFGHFISLVQSKIFGPAAPGVLIAQLDRDRNLCAKPRFNYALCERGLLEHQKSKCAPAHFEMTKCQVKL
jgi:hypothetical protein